ncbi:MAG: RluA family pseudouridine synthase [Rhodoferax sp.]|nr:RluA family pseudouridine synthase [Rhodoferax sp.]
MKHIIGVNSTEEAAVARTLQVDLDDAGQRLDNFLIRLLKGVPKTHVYRIIRSGEVRVNKGRVGVERRLLAGDLVRLPPVRTSQRAADKAVALAAGVSLFSGAASAGRALATLFEDEAVLAVDKPAGVAVHGGSGVSFGVIELLRMARPTARFLELVHRLDRETSGILLVAKKRSALVHLQDQFRARDTNKTYLALVAGHWPSQRKVLDTPLRKFLLPDGERRVCAATRDHPDAMTALTLVKVASAGERFSLLEVTIKTGRTHQIRVHLAAQGMPIAGDDKYGDFELNKALRRTNQPVPLQRMFLHAWRLQFMHPASGEKISLVSRLPDELQRFCDHAFPRHY